MQTGPIAFIGFGEAARAFLGGWNDSVRLPEIRAYDVKIADAGTADGILRVFREYGIDGAVSPDAALTGAGAVFSVVTADQALAAAEAAAPHLGQGCFWFDCNSCAPETKRRAAAVIEAAGGRYVDVAVMAPVYPKRHHVPLLVSGPHADHAMEMLTALDMKPRGAGDRVGRASSIKMLRSVMIKGMEALTAECFLAARKAGVEDEVIGSLEASDPAVNWRERGAYNLERMMVHGARRAAEMREVALTVRDLRLGGEMSAAAADWQDRVADAGAEPGDDDLIGRIDRLLARL